MINKRLKLRINIVSILCLSLLGCTSIPINQVDDRIHAWKNASIEQVIKYWGVPTKQQEIGGNFYAEWLNKESSPGNTAVSLGSGSHSRHSSIGFGLTLFDLGGTDDVCSRIVTYDKNGTVTDVSWKGTQDYCFEITPDREKILRAKAIMQDEKP
jgi:hypothetical protein